jgi:hypothetical protein
VLRSWLWFASHRTSPVSISQIIAYWTSPSKELAVLSGFRNLY